MFTACGGPKGNYGLRGEDYVAVLLAGGDSVEDVLKQLHQNSELVDGSGIDKNPLKGIDDIKELIKEGEKVGVEF